MSFERRRFFIQVSLAGLVAALLVVSAPIAPASQLATAINYTYHMVLPQVASDGVP